MSNLNPYLDPPTSTSLIDPNRSVDLVLPIILSLPTRTSEIANYRGLQDCLCTVTYSIIVIADKITLRVERSFQ